MTIFFHIGTEKTGTTSIQSFLNLNRKKLQQEGICYPVSAGDINQTKLMFYAKNEPEDDETGMTFRLFTPRSAESFRKEMKQELQEEIGNCLPVPQIIVFSNEHCSSRLTHAEELERLRSLFSVLTDKIRIIIYLRRQDDFLLSSYSTMVKSGYIHPFAVPEMNIETMHRYNYLKLLDLWSGVFGKENLIIKIFDRSSIVSGDIVRDFSNIIGIDCNNGYKIPEEKNRSLDRFTLEFLKKFNAYVPLFTGKKINPVRGNIVNILTDMSGHDRMIFDSDELNKFYRQFEKSNRDVAVKFLGRKDGILFNQTSPVEKSTDVFSPHLDIERAVKISSSIWIETQKELRRLKVQVGMLRFEKFMQNKDYQSARTVLENVLAIDESNLKVWEMLYKVYLALEDKKGIKKILDLFELNNPEFYKKLTLTRWELSGKKSYLNRIIEGFRHLLK